MQKTGVKINESYKCNMLMLFLISSVDGSRKIRKTMIMKNEPVVSYNHMQEEDAITTKKARIPYSLYILLVVDAILISAIAVFVAKIIF